MKKDDAETRIRQHCYDWAREKGYRQTGDEEPRFTEFLEWVRERDPECLEFRTRSKAAMSNLYLIEKWWASEMGQTWRY